LKLKSLLHTASMKFEFINLESCFYKRQVSFLVVKTAKCKRGINYDSTLDLSMIIRTPGLAVLLS